MNNPLRFTDPSGWVATISNNEAWEQYVNSQFSWLESMGGSSRNTCGGGGGGGGWGGIGGVVPGGIHWMSRDIKIDDLQSLYNVTSSNGKLYTYSNVNGDWYNTSTSTVSIIIEFNNKNQDSYDGGLLASKVPGSYGKPYHVADNTALKRVVVPLSIISAAVSDNYHFSLGITDFTQYIPGPIGKFSEGLEIGEMLKSFRNQDYSTTVFQAIEIAGGEYTTYLKVANWMLHTDKMQLGMAAIFYQEYIRYQYSDPVRAKRNLHLYQECYDNTTNE